MSEGKQSLPERPAPARYRWPLFVAAAVLLGVILAAVWMSKEIARTRQIRDLNAPPRDSATGDIPARTGFPAVLSAELTNHMIWIPGGSYWMGSEDGQTDEKPAHEVAVDGFWMDKTEVTNERFEKFVRATGYVTIAERKPDPKDFPGAPPEMLVPGSIVFVPPSLEEINRERAKQGMEPLSQIPLENHFLWWRYVPGASWRHPEGPDSDIRGREKHPVVHVSWDDAAAFCRWAGTRLPTEAEWEYAARGGLVRQAYAWGPEQKPGGKWLANIWQGRFPAQNTTEDGFSRTAPVASFPSNAYGLYDMAGNVWEWCADWYLPDYYAHSPQKNPPGPETSYDPNEPGTMKRVQRGGSFLCSDLYCIGYRPGARMKSTPDTGLSHSGFRTVKTASAPSS